MNAFKETLHFYDQNFFDIGLIKISSPLFSFHYNLFLLIKRLYFSQSMHGPYWYKFRWSLMKEAELLWALQALRLWGFSFLFPSEKSGRFDFDEEKSCVWDNAVLQTFAEYTISSFSPSSRPLKTIPFQNISKCYLLKLFRILNITRYCVVIPSFLSSFLRIIVSSIFTLGLIDFFSFFVIRMTMMETGGVDFINICVQLFCKIFVTHMFWQNFAKKRWMAQIIFAMKFQHKSWWKWTR